jgi:hypothetical protein
MAQVICTLPNASSSINGVKFTEDKGQMVSEEVTDDVAAHFASIRGYKLVRKAEPKAKAAASASAAAPEPATAAPAPAADPAAPAEPAAPAAGEAKKAEA